MANIGPDIVFIEIYKVEKSMVPNCLNIDERLVVSLVTLKKDKWKSGNQNFLMRGY